ncbi:MAG TPA: hypothetical protein VF599_08260 [Pyrinomonadaceae bacterium]|jgi:hypothetical protein
MKIAFALLFLVLISVSSVLSQEMSGKDLRDKDSDRKTVDGFGGHLIVIKNPREFIQEWLKAEAPQINPAKNVKVDESIGALVFFAGCKTDKRGVCNAEVDYTIYNPDGSLFVERKAQPLWKEKAPPPPNAQMGKAILAFRMAENKPAGEYKVKAKVSDLNADISFELETKFRLEK